MNPSSTQCRSIGLFLMAIVMSACSNQKPVPVPTGDTFLSSPCASLAWGGFPRLKVTEKGNFFICHKGYALDYNPTPKVALWVVERLEAKRLEKPREPIMVDFRPDPFLPGSQRSTIKHYLGSPYNAGLLAPVEDFQDDPAQINQAFYFSNTIAQDPDNNRGIWQLLEDNVRRWAKDRGELFVITGPMFSGGQPQSWIGAPVISRRRFSKPTEKELLGQKMGVPTHLYKVIVDPAAQKAIAFVIPNTPQESSPESLARFAVSVATLESVGVVQFFPNLPQNVANQLKNQVDGTHWPLLPSSNAK